MTSEVQPNGAVRQAGEAGSNLETQPLRVVGIGSSAGESRRFRRCCAPFRQARQTPMSWLNTCHQARTVIWLSCCHAKLK